MNSDVPPVPRTPRSLDLDITSRCNLKCRYCSHFASAGDVRADIPTEEWLKFFEELKRCAVMNVCISGGEPFCRPDIHEIIAGVIKNKMRFSILTNGTLIDDNIAAQIAETKRCDSIQVSIDGSISTSHDACRGEGSFRRAIEGIQCLRDHNLPVTVRVTIHKDNVGELHDIAEMLLEEIGLPSFSTNSASYMGLCRQNAEQVMLNPNERYLAMEILLRLEKKYKNRIEAQAGPLAEARNWRYMEDARARDLVQSGGYLTGCGGPLSKLAVRADGVVIPCIHLSHIELGRINEDDLREIWLNHPDLRGLRQRREIPLSSFEFCKGCAYMKYCTGNCPALAYTILGKVNHPSPDACLSRYLEAGGKLLTADHRG